MNPRRYSQIERALHILDKSGTVDVLRDDQYLLFLFKKTERVVAALYVVTGLFPDAEPLKWSLRESGTLLIRHTLSFKERATLHSKEFISDTLAELARTLSLIDLAHIADLLSPMNFSVLKKELEIVLSIIDGRWRMSTIPASPPLFEENFFGIAKGLFEAEASKTESSIPLASLDAPAVSEATFHSLSELERFKRLQKDMHKGHQEVKDIVLKKGAESGDADGARPRIPHVKRPHGPAFDRVREGRRESILEVLRQKESAMIKDFSAVITGCSEKTIQRMLIDMVGSGVLKREGDRRWSRYFLVTPHPKGEQQSAAKIVR